MICHLSAFRKVFFLFFVITAYNNVSAYAQETTEIRNFRILDYKDGIPENDIKETVIDDQNGYWLRTSQNVVYFNGHEFISYNNTNDIFHLNSKLINDIFFYKNKIYVFGDSGIDEIDCISKRSKKILEGTFGLNFLAGIITRKGKLLAISEKGEIFFVENQHLNKIGKIDIYTSLQLHETASGHIFISNEHKTILIFSTTLKRLNKIEFSNNSLINKSIHEYPGLGTIIIISKLAFLYHSSTFSLKSISLPVTFGRDFYCNNKSIYVISDFKKIHKYDVNTNKKMYLNIKIDKNFSINEMTLDKKNTVVLSTNQGLFLFREPVSFLSKIDSRINQSNLESIVRRSILETTDGRIVQLNYHNIFLYNPRTKSNNVISKTNIDSYAGLIDSSNIWIGLDGSGLCKFDLNTLKYSKIKSFENIGSKTASHITSIIKYSKNKLLFGEAYNSKSSLKLYDIKNDVTTPFFIKGLKSKYITQKISAILTVDINNKWICSNQGLYLLNHKDSLSLFLGRKEIGTDSVNYAYKDGFYLWIATNNGLLKYDLNKKKIIKTFNINNGFGGNKCISILPDQFSTLWVPTFTGLSRIHMSTSKIINYHVEDGFLDDEYNYSSYLKTKSGDIFLGGLNGYVQIHPEAFDQNLSMYSGLKLDYVIRYSKSTSNKVKFLNSENIKIHQTKEQLEISFSAMEPIASQYVLFYFRIKGIQKEWVALNRQNKIQLSNLPTGKLLLELKSRFLNNSSKESIIYIPINVYVHWYESKIFYFLITAAIILFIFYFLYFKYKAKLEFSKVKIDLARDIHDEIGTLLTKSLLRIEILRYKEKIIADELKKIESGLRETIQSFRNVLWSINTDNQYAEDFVSRIQNILDDVFEDTSFEVTISNLASDKFFITSIRVKRNLLLIIKEVANNALKHSNGNLFELVIRKDGNSWNFLLADNGTNTDVFHNSINGIGLQSIENRVKSIKGELLIQKESHGFFVKIKL